MATYQVHPFGPAHSASLYRWDTLAESPEARAALPIGEVLALLMWNDPNGAWSEIIDARNNPHVCDDDCRAWGCSYNATEFDVSDDEIREAFELMISEG